MKAKVFRKLMEKKARALGPNKVTFGQNYAVFEFQWEYDSKKSFEAIKLMSENSHYSKFRYFLDSANKKRFVVVNFS